MTNQISEFICTATPEAVASFHEDGIVILHTGKGCLFTANGTGARIWCGVMQQQSLDSIADEISGEYQIPPSTAREHVGGFLVELERNQLIKREAVS